jgi:hypothetical protein
LRISRRWVFFGWFLYGMLLTNMMAGMEGIASGVMKSDEEMMGTMHFLVIGNLLSGLLLASLVNSKRNDLECHFLCKFQE